jgi:Tfp pilus assembly protein PilO
MVKSFSFRQIGERLRVSRLPAGNGKDPRLIVRAVLAVLLLANLAAALLVFKPWAASQAELEGQAAALRREVQQRRDAITNLRVLVDKAQKGRQEGDQFLTGYFMNSRTAYSTAVSELMQAAQRAGMRPREHSFEMTPVEGSDDLSMMSVTGGYEGAYGDLIQFVNLLDRSPRFLILDSLQAVPVQDGAQLSVALKLNTFVRETNEPAQLAQVAESGAEARADSDAEESQ